MLLHHIYDVERLRRAYLGMKRGTAAGVDGLTWKAYGERLEENVPDFSGRLKRGAYRAKPLRRAFIPKAGGQLRPLGVPSLEDKIVQRAAVEVLSYIYEADFHGFSYEFRPGRSPYLALDALAVGIRSQKVRWVLDADLRGSSIPSTTPGWRSQRHPMSATMATEDGSRWLRGISPPQERAELKLGDKELERVRGSQGGEM